MYFFGFFLGDFFSGCVWFGWIQELRTIFIIHSDLPRHKRVPELATEPTNPDWIGVRFGFRIFWFSDRDSQWQNSNSIGFGFDDDGRFRDKDTHTNGFDWWFIVEVRGVVVVVVVDVVVDVSVQSRGHKTEAHQRDRDTNKKTMDKITKINHPKFH